MIGSVNSNKSQLINNKTVVLISRIQYISNCLGEIWHERISMEQN